MSIRIDPGKLGWVTAELSLASYVGISTVYLLFYATEVLRIPAAWAGVALLLPRIWNFLADPIVGVLSDRTRSRFGRRRPFLLAGALVWAAAFWALFNLPRQSAAVEATLLFAGVFLINNTGLALFQVPYSAMLAEFTSNPAERTRLVAYREVAARAAILLTLALAPAILAGASSRESGFRWVGVAFSAVILASGLLAFFATAKMPATEASAGSHKGFVPDLAPVAQNRPFATVSLSFMFVNLGDAVFSGSLVYFVTQWLHSGPGLIGALYPISSISGIVSAPVWSYIAVRFGKALTCRWAMAFNGLVCLAPLLIRPSEAWSLYLFMSAYGIFNTGARLLPNAMVPDTVEFDQKLTGERREGIIFGLFVFVQQTAFAAGGFLLSLLLTGAGVGAEVNVSGTAVLLCFALVPAVLYGAAGLTLLGYRLP